MKISFRRLVLYILAGFLLIAVATVPWGTSGSSAPRATAPAPKAPFICVRTIPTEAGVCIRQQLFYEGKQPAAPPLSLTFGARTSAGQCVDVSQYQGIPDFRASSVKCAIVQTNDGAFRNPLFYQQTAQLRHQGVPFGVYTFVEAYSGSFQAATAAAMARGQGATLGAWADTEVPGAYQQACSYEDYARSHGFRIVGTYASPGNYNGGRCTGVVWPAEWGSGPAYPLPGYPRSSVVLRQWCGTCRLTGFSGEVDRDEDLGLLRLAKPAPRPPTKAQVRAREERELHAHSALLAELHRDVDLRHCRPGPPWYGHADPRRYHTLCGRWLRHGGVEVRYVRNLRAALR